MIQFACHCSARHEQASPIPPECWNCGDRMRPYGEYEPARSIGEIIEPIVDDIMLKARANA